MFRIVVGVLAAFVGFSFGHSIPKWMENKSRSTTETKSPSSTESAHPVRKLLLRRKSLRKFKFGFQKSGKENAEIDKSLQQLSRDNREGNGYRKCLQNSPVCASTWVCSEHKTFKVGSQKSSKESSFEDYDSSPTLPLCAVNVDYGSCPHQDTSSNVDNGNSSVQEMCTKSKIGHSVQQKLHAEVVSPVESELREPVFCKISSMQSMCGSPVKEKSQMKQWKMKLMSLRSKAMASEKVWYEKFENENYGGKLLTSSAKGTAKKQAKGKENESPLLTSTKKRELLWSRSSSSKVGVLVECPKSVFERYGYS